MFISINNRNGLVDISSGSRVLVRRGGEKLGQNFKHEFLSSPVLQWPRQNFGSGGRIQQKCTHKRLLKIIEKFIKYLHKSLKNLQNFSKIKFNKSKENL